MEERKYLVYETPKGDRCGDEFVEFFDTAEEANEAACARQAAPPVQSLPMPPGSFFDPRPCDTTPASTAVVSSDQDGNGYNFWHTAHRLHSHKTSHMRLHIQSYPLDNHFV